MFNADSDDSKKRLGPQLLESSILSIKSKPYDPEMLYVECKICGKPVVWEPGKTTHLLRKAQVNLDMLDETCLILSNGCSACHPEADGYTLAMVHLSSLSPRDLKMLSSARAGKA